MKSEHLTQALLVVLILVTLYRGDGGSVEHHGGEGEGGKAEGGSVTNYVGSEPYQAEKEAAERRGYYTTDDMEKLLGVEERTLYNWRERGWIFPGPEKDDQTGELRYPLEFEIRK